MAAKPVSVVLVHGGFVDGSGWESVYQILKEDGYSVSIVQNPTISLAGDVDATRRVIDAQSQPVVLVGHSYGGAVITEAGNHPSVIALVYVAAFAPDKGESVNSLIKDPPPGAPVPPIVGPKDGFLALDKAKFAASFAGDVPKDKAAFMNADSTFIIVGGPSEGNWLGAMTVPLKAWVMSPFVSQKYQFFLADLNKEDLNLIADLMQTGKVTPVIDRRYKLSQVPEAIAYLEEGHARGKVVIEME